jgi:hypothetical protein
VADDEGPEPEDLYPDAPHANYTDEQGLLTEVSAPPDESGPDDSDVVFDDSEGEAFYSPYDEVIFDDSEGEVLILHITRWSLTTRKGRSSLRNRLIEAPSCRTERLHRAV